MYWRSTRCAPWPRRGHGRRSSAWPSNLVQGFLIWRWPRLDARLPLRSARPFADLTDREHEVLELIAQGQSNPAIAERLVLSVKTVQNHVSNILGKLQAVDRAQVIVRARDAGFGHET